MRGAKSLFKSLLVLVVVLASFSFLVFGNETLGEEWGDNVSGSTSRSEVDDGLLAESDFLPEPENMNGSVNITTGVPKSSGFNPVDFAKSNLWLTILLVGIFVLWILWKVFKFAIKLAVWATVIMVVFWIIRTWLLG